jgi:hypothetical protein
MIAWSSGRMWPGWSDIGGGETPSGPSGHLPQKGGDLVRQMLPLWGSCRAATEGAYAPIVSAYSFSSPSAFTPTVIAWIG